MAEKGDAHGGASLPFNSSPFTTSAGDAAAEVPVAKAPAPKVETPVAKAPVMKAEAHVAIAQAPKAETPVTNVPAQKAEAPVAKAPVTQAEAPVANVPAQKTETHVAKAPVQKAETHVANVPAQKVETPVAKAPAQKAETPVANVPTQKALTPVAKAPAQKVETPVAQAPAQKAETMSRQLPAVLIPSRDPGALLSGGGISFLTGNRTARFSYGYSTFKGKRSSMEDFFETSISEVDGQMVAFFGVFDGHGGSRTAEYLKNNLFKNLCSHPGFIKDTKSAIVEAFQQTDADYLKEEKGQQKDAGSTASTAVLVGDRLLVANVGDSRVVACRAGSAIPLSIDHKPDRSDERERIEQAGGFVMWAGTWRVGGVLAVSRAFGDKLLKPYVVAEPEIQEEEIDGVDFIIIASDGLWNVLSNKDAVALVENIQDAEAASRKLIEDAYAKGSSDNITCVVVRFEDSSSSSSTA